MNYEEARLKIKDGDVLAWSHYSWSSWYDIQVQAVRIATESEYCHVALAHWHADRLWIIESVEPLIRMVPLSNVIGEHGFYWIDVDTPMSAEELNFACSKIGIGHYSKLEAIKAQIVGNLSNQDDEHWECAKFVNACRRLSGRDFGPKDTPSAVVEKALVNGLAVQRVVP